VNPADASRPGAIRTMTIRIVPVSTPPWVRSNRMVSELLPIRSTVTS